MLGTGYYSDVGDEVRRKASFAKGVRGRLHLVKDKEQQENLIVSTHDESALQNVSISD
jgi:hypothetical protein